MPTLGEVIKARRDAASAAALAAATALAKQYAELAQSASRSYVDSQIAAVRADADKKFAALVKANGLKSDGLL